MRCEYCARTVTSHQRMKICNRCYSFFYYWTRKGVAAMLARQEYLGLADRRLAALLGKLSHIRRRAGA